MSDPACGVLFMVYAYCRRSSKNDSVERQIQNVKNRFPDAVIIIEEYTKSNFDLPAWKQLMEIAKSGDLIVYPSSD